MCLAIPGKILKINEKVGTVDFGGVRRDVRLDLLERVQEGDYILVHVGYAIQVLDRSEAEKILKAWGEIAGDKNHA
jgi:hydrogenase expression/formation protein HypC